MRCIISTRSSAPSISPQDSANKENILTIGWRIVNSEEDTLVEHAGLAFGQTTTFCAEGYGLLSVARFSHHMSQYTNQGVRCEISTNIDNKDIVKKINNQLKYTHDYLFSTLELDWVIVVQSAHTLKSYGTNLTIAHIKSHQDNKVLLDGLDLPARLNVVAD
eukprot:6678561-Ditylum_brightwellii.AAC.1